MNLQVKLHCIEHRWHARKLDASEWWLFQVRGQTPKESSQLNTEGVPSTTVAVYWLQCIQHENDRCHATRLGMCHAINVDVCSA